MEPATQQLILDEVRALKGQVAELAIAINGGRNAVGMAEELRESKRDRDQLWEELDALRVEHAATKAELNALKSAPGKLALTWFDRVAVFVLMSLLGGIGYLVGAYVKGGLR